MIIWSFDMKRPGPPAKLHSLDFGQSQTYFLRDSAV